MKRKCASVKFNPVDSHATQNLQSPDPDDKRMRLERRWKRRENMVDTLKHTRVASASKTASKIRGSTDVLVDTNDHMRDDEADKEWITIFDTYTSDEDADEVDEDYNNSFWATFNPDSGGSNIDIDESGGSNVDVNFGNNNVSEETEEDNNCFSKQFVSDYISNGVDVNVDEDDQLLRKSSGVGQNSLVSEQEFDTPEVQCVVDEDYEQFLNSGSVVDGDFVFGCEENTKNTSNVEDDSNSSDSDVVVLESCPNCENTPFVSSKTYDPSCFGEEMHPKDNMQKTSFYHSQFRKRLMEYLDRPYDYEEYKSLLIQAYERKERERHLETRRGTIESYRSVGVSKSYLQVHPDLTKTIFMESKEKPRVLFLLRGLFFWLENLAHEGQFQPWRDKACLEIMRKM